MWRDGYDVLPEHCPPLNTTKAFAEGVWLVDGPIPASERAIGSVAIFIGTSLTIYYTTSCNIEMDEISVALPPMAMCGATSEPLSERELLTPSEALAIARCFKLLANDTRLRLLHALERAGELSVQSLAKTIEMSPQAVSNQLQRLVDREVLATRRDGNSIWYRVVDPCLPALLELGLCLTGQQARKKGAPDE